jgi:ubiquinone/menaquinone biosynthesis C-methylase UbiE
VNNPIFLNVGSGQCPFDQSRGWVNIDKVAHEGMPIPDLICDGANLPYEDNSIDLVVSQHCLEHFGCGDGQGLIRESYRVLKPGRSLIVTVPDLRALAVRWLEGGLSTQIYVTNLYGAWMGYDEDRHKWGFDRESLKEELRHAAQWSGVSDFDFRPIPGAQIARDFWILGVEATK